MLSIISLYLIKKNENPVQISYEIKCLSKSIFDNDLESTDNEFEEIDG